MKQHHASLLEVADAVHRFFSRTFARVDICGPAIDPAFFRKYPVMIAGTHRSHVDYFILGQVMHDLGAENIRFAAGENLTTFPWIGPRFRSFGAFSVKRGSTFSRGYVRQLCEQVVGMLQDGDTIMVFPEAGRSYSGEMLDLRGGILGAGVVLQDRGGTEPVHIIPAAVSYERLPELPYFGLIALGRSLRGTSNPLKRMLGSALYFGSDIWAFARFTNARRFGRRFGEVYIDYGAPLSLDSLVDIKGSRAGRARDELSANRVAVQTLCEKLHEQFCALYRILPQHVLARALQDRGALSVGELEVVCREVVNRAREQGRNVSLVGPMSDSELAARALEQMRYTRCVRNRNGVVSSVKPSIVRYYAAAVPPLEGACGVQ